MATRKTGNVGGEPSELQSSTSISRDVGVTKTTSTSTSTSTTLRFWTAIIITLCMISLKTGYTVWKDYRSFLTSSTVTVEVRSPGVEGKSTNRKESEETPKVAFKKGHASSNVKDRWGPTNSSNKNTVTVTASLSSNMRKGTLDHIDRHLLERITAQAKAFVEERKQAYIAKDSWQTFTWRGIGYVWLQYGLILAAVLPQSPVKAGPNKVTIVNVLTDPAPVGVDCSIWTLWVRVAGPEIFAGNATAVQHATDDKVCFWEFYFDLQVAGNYVVDAKLVHVGAEAFFDGSECTTNIIPLNTVEEMEVTVFGNSTFNRSAYGNDTKIPAVPLTHQYPVHGGFLGFKLYTAAYSCCEICARLAPHCIYWSSPPANFFKEAAFYRTGCELYFRNGTAETHPDVVPKSYLLSNLHLLDRRQRRRKLEQYLTSSFTSYSMPIHVTFVDEPDFILFDRINRTFAERRLRQQQGHRRLNAELAHGRPRKSGPKFYHIGCGWNYWWTLDFPCLSGELDDQIFLIEKEFALLDENVAVKPKATEAAPLPLCTPEDEAFDKHHGRWVRRPWPTEQQCPNAMKIDENFKSKFEIMEVDPDHPLCWHRDDFSNVGFDCIEMNCRFIQPWSRWVSHLHNETQWYGYWKNYNCDYVDFTNAQLAQCFAEKKIGSVTSWGYSIAEFLNEYLQQRLKGVPMYSGDDAIAVTFTTLGLLHRFGPRFVEVINEEWPAKDPSKELVYHVAGFYMSSERDTFCNTITVEHFSRLAFDLLWNRTGYTGIQLYDMSASFTFDTATQFDGVHIVGPPMKMALTKFFHFLCSDVVEGTRLE